MLQVRGLGKRYGGRQVLKDASLDVAEGEHVAVIGSSGDQSISAFLGAELYWPNHRAKAARSCSFSVTIACRSSMACAT